MLETGDVFEDPSRPHLTYSVVRKMNSYEELQKVVKRIKNLRFENLNAFNNQGLYPIYMIKTLVVVSELSETPSQFWIVSNDHQNLKSIEVTRGTISTEQR